MTRKPTRSLVRRRVAVALAAVGLFCAPSVVRGATFATDGLGREESDDLIERARLPAPFGQEDNWWWTAATGVGIDLRRSAQSYSVHLAASYFLVDDFSIDVQGSFFYVDQDFDEAAAGSLALLFRQHWRVGETYNTFFIDAGLGFLVATERVPAGDGAQYGFTPQIGAGMTIPVGPNNARLVLGAKWHHVSTARLNGSEKNQGRDALLLHVGMTFPF